jgi:hypothetical protein
VAADSSENLIDGSNAGGIATVVPQTTICDIAPPRTPKKSDGTAHACQGGFGSTRMWIQIGAAAGAVVLVMALIKRISRQKTKAIDVGPVSDAWLAEQRARGRDSV